MPFVEVQTNLAGSRFSEDFLRKLSSCVAATLGKPEEVRVSGYRRVSFRSSPVWFRQCVLVLNQLFLVASVC